MKTIKLKHLIMLLCICLSLGVGCDNDDKTKADCGCDSETLSVISESDNLIGQIWYKTKQNSNDDDYYNDKYWISVIIKDSDNVNHYIVCNEDIISEDIKLLAKTTEDTEVQFAGHVKGVCEKKIDIPERTYSRIVLTKIELK
ncbi:MAG: hypothetical protein N4A59_08745 [Marinifilum sp.]|jgi:hypothetical protein|nr:hypothetical protein [Marinifilum sp.]